MLKLKKKNAVFHNKLSKDVLPTCNMLCIFYGKIILRCDI